MDTWSSFSSKEFIKDFPLPHQIWLCFSLLLDFGDINSDYAI